VSYKCYFINKTKNENILKQIHDIGPASLPVSYTHTHTHTHTRGIDRFIVVSSPNLCTPVFSFSFSFFFFFSFSQGIDRFLVVSSAGLDIMDPSSAYFQPQPRMSKYCFFQFFFIYILCTSSLSPACLSTPPYFQPQPRMSVNLFLQISFLLTASAAHVRGFVFSFLFFYFQHQARMSKCCVLQSIFI